MSGAAPSAWAQDALFVGQLMVARLRDQVPLLRDVALVDQVALDKGEITQFPSAVVMLHSMAPKDAVEGRNRCAVDQRWLVVLAVQNVRAARDRMTADASPLIAPCVRALFGFTPQGANRPLVWVPGPRPDHGPNVSYYPLMWSIQLTND